MASTLQAGFGARTDGKKSKCLLTVIYHVLVCVSEFSALMTTSFRLESQCLAQRLAMRRHVGRDCHADR